MNGHAPTTGLIIARASALMCALGMVAGCVSLPQATPTEAFQLSAAPAAAQPTLAAAQPASATRAVVAVDTPLAQGLLASDRIVVVDEGRRAVVTGARWDDAMPEMLRREIARALQGGGAVDVVDPAQRAGRAGYALVTVIEAMEAEIQPDFSAEAVSSIAARLVRLPDRQIVSTNQFTARAPAADDAPETLTAAISEANARATADLAAWVAGAAGAGG